MELVLLVLDRGLIAVAFLRNDVDDHRLVVGLGLHEGLLEQGDVMSVDDTAVFEMEGIEHGRRLENLLHRVFHPSGKLIGRLSDDWNAPEHLPDGLLRLLVARIDPIVGQRREATHCGRVGTTVVVEDDDQLLGLGDRDVVQRLIGHTARQGTVTNHRNSPAVVTRHRMTRRVAQRGRRVAVLDKVVRRLLRAGIAGQTAGVTQLIETIGPTGEDLVHVRLVPHVPDQPIIWGVEDPM